MAKTKVIGHSWSFAKLWNEAALSLPERPLQKRNYIWASELGLGFCDRYLKMHAITPTNPPNDRSRRKFVSGDIWEWLIGLVLTATGVLKEKQLRGEVELPGCLRVSGKIDFIAGGVIDWEKAKHEIMKMQQVFDVSLEDTPRFIAHAVSHIICRMEKEYGSKPLKEMIIENKAISAFMANKIESGGKAMPHNVLQTSHYLIANPLISEAKLNYICKDDNIMYEFSIERERKLMQFYRDDVTKMTEIYNASDHSRPLKTMPAPEPEVLFDQNAFRFEKNFRVEYSNYLTLIYKYKTPEDYRMTWQKKVTDWNRVFKRCVKGENITPANRTIITEVTRFFPEWDKWIDKAKASGIMINEQEEEQ